MHRHVINGIIPVARQSRNFKNLTVLVPKEQKRFMRMVSTLDNGYGSMLMWGRSIVWRRRKKRRRFWVRGMGGVG